MPEASIPVAEERLTIDKRVVETGRVRIRTVVDEKLVRVGQDLERDDVRIERVPVNREVSEPPQAREENGVLIVPILEEVVVLEKRLVLKEELHVHRNRSREHVEEAVRLRSTRPELQRVAASPAKAASPSKAANPAKAVSPAEATNPARAVNRENAHPRETLPRTGIRRKQRLSPRG